MKRKSAGFTLMEIMLVIVLLGILVTAGFGAYKSSQMRGRDARRKGDIRNIASAIEQYYNDKNQFPTGASGDIYGCGAGDSQICDWGSPLVDSRGTVYMVQIPRDPQSTSNYYFVGDGTMYQIYARLENKQDNDVPKSGSTPQAYTGMDCGLGLCNYVLSSVNLLPSSLPALVNDP